MTGGVQSEMASPVSCARTRHCTPYCLPSSVREKYHQSSLRDGTDRSVSTVWALISPKMARRSGSWSSVTVAV
jgi:hypothetical protein